MKYIISVAKTYKHRGKRHHRDDTKKHWFVYYYDEDRVFHSDQVSFAKAMYYKKRRLHRIRYWCEICDYIFLAIVKSKKETPQCPNCEV